MAHQKAASVFGAGGVAYLQPEELVAMLELLEKYGVKEIDSASVYGSDAILGNIGATEKFTVSTKAPIFRPGAGEKQTVIDGMNHSLTDLRVNSVDLYYLHAPDINTPIEETLSAIQQLYTEGKFKHFGLSNFGASDVQKIHAIQSAANSVLPTVYQGNYNAVARHHEQLLLPTLRALKISYYAYSPIAGGFLVKDPATLRAKKDDGRFAAGSVFGSMYYSLYGKESLYEGLEEWGAIARDAGISKAALAYRWVAWHSALKGENGDAIILGARNSQQLGESLAAIEEGPLGADVVERIEKIWELVRDEAPVDNFVSFFQIGGKLGE